MHRGLQDNNGTGYPGVKLKGFHMKRILIIVATAGMVLMGHAQEVNRAATVRQLDALRTTVTNAPSFSISPADIARWNTEGALDGPALNAKLLLIEEMPVRTPAEREARYVAMLVALIQAFTTPVVPPAPAPAPEEG